MPDYPPSPPSIPYAPSAVEVPRRLVDPALLSWATSKGYQLNPFPSAAWYQGWGPFRYLFEIQGVGLELICDFGEADLWIVEAYDSGNIEYDKTGAFKYVGSRHTLGFVTSPHLRARGASWSRQDADLKHELGKAFGSLFSGGQKQASPLGDARFESFYEVAVPSQPEGVVAFTPTLRRLMLERQFRGIIEVRAGGMVFAPSAASTFDEGGLERLIALFGELYGAAVNPNA